jgi:AraC-like DNA-binding protein
MSLAPDIDLVMTHGRFRRRPLGPALKDHFRSRWTYEVARSSPGVLTVLPDGLAHLRWLDGVLTVTGPDLAARSEPLPPGGLVVGFSFQPGAVSRWLGAPVAELDGGRLALERLWGPSARRLAEWAGEARDADGVANRLAWAFGTRAAGSDTPDPALRKLFTIVEAAPNPPRLDALARAVNSSPRTLRRRCHQDLGYGPKTLERVVRFQRFVRLATTARDSDLAGLAHEAGYADQAHLSRETRRLCGISPGGLVAQLRG